MRKTFTLLFMSLSVLLNAQNLPSLKWDDVIKWSRITDNSISDSGNYVAVQSEEWKSDGTLKLYNNKAVELAEFKSVKSHKFIGENYLFLVQKPSKTLLDSLERAKSKSKPLDVIVIYDLKNRAIKLSVDSIKSYKIVDKGEFFAYKRGKKENDSLHLSSILKSISIEDVDKFEFSDELNKLVYSKSDSLSGSVCVLNLRDLKAEKVYESTKMIKNISVSSDGEALAFVAGEKNDGKGVSNVLFYYNGELKEVGVAQNAAEGSIINEYASLSFSKLKNRLYYGTSPKYIEKDTLTLVGDKAVVDVWHWSEPTLHTVQLVNREKDLKSSYKAIYSPSENINTQLEDKATPKVVVSEEGDGFVVVAQTNEPYKIEQMWLGGTHTDLYLTDLVSGEKTIIEKKLRANVRISPKGKYLYWFLPSDSSWYSYSVDLKKKVKLTSPKDFIAYDDLSDVPDYPSEYGVGTWSENDESLYVYSKYDIWALDPSGVAPHKNITQNGESTSTTYSIVSFDKEKKFYSKKESLFLSTFNNITKGGGYATVSFLGGVPKMLTTDEMRFSSPKKAKNSDVIIFTKESFELSPNIYLSDLSLKKQTQLSDINPQQSNFNWGTVELISWVSLAGDSLEGLLYKPQNFDPNKKYPMICNFYERDTDKRFSYRTPEPHRSTIDYHYYTSNGYVIFNPDIKYRGGEPGKNCYDALMPAIDKIVEMGFVDSKRIGAQGHSWGGYQVAYLATKTDRFAAIESGAPVVNMLSAYGGIRWETGLNRAFQYERGQSRVGSSIWDAPEKYLDNSPLLEMDKVTTPILIMHNDKDGHVPWWQGIEYFIALRRLQKPVWLLNYNDEPHWPMKIANKIDFQIRMAQFFDHYLKGAPAAEWMRIGVPAVNKFQ